ncbi:MAG: hypothetical protein IKN27_00990, partial [Selenomonadaceae bacterium]|nr:hypothetical protein [Selenomonadaceae bacterium]
MEYLGGVTRQYTTRTKGEKAIKDAPDGAIIQIVAESNDGEARTEYYRAYGDYLQRLDENGRQTGHSFLRRSSNMKNNMPTLGDKYLKLKSITITERPADVDTQKLMALAHKNLKTDTHPALKEWLDRREKALAESTNRYDRIRRSDGILDAAIFTPSDEQLSKDEAIYADMYAKQARAKTSEKTSDTATEQEETSIEKSSTENTTSLETELQTTTDETSMPPESTAETVTNSQNNGGVNFETGTFTHTKTGENLAEAKLKNKIERDNFSKLKDIAKNHNGYYSNFSKSFLFKSPTDRDAFVQEVVGESKNDNQDKNNVAPKDTTKKITSTPETKSQDAAALSTANNSIISAEHKAWQKNWDNYERYEDPDTFENENEITDRGELQLQIDGNRPFNAAVYVKWHEDADSGRVIRAKGNIANYVVRVYLDNAPETVPNDFDANLVRLAQAAGGQVQKSRGAGENQFEFNDYQSATKFATTIKSELQKFAVSRKTAEVSRPAVPIDNQQRFDDNENAISQRVFD